jgi:hypothetical protein
MYLLKSNFPHTMPFYTIMYNERQIMVDIAEPEVQVKRLKNNILYQFDTITYDNIRLFLEENDTLFSLDDNEMVDTEMNLVLEVEL